jgi:hypothetical protein
VVIDKAVNTLNTCQNNKVIPGDLLFNKTKDMVHLSPPKLLPCYALNEFNQTLPDRHNNSPQRNLTPHLSRDFEDFTLCAQPSKANTISLSPSFCFCKALHIALLNKQKSSTGELQAFTNPY